MTDEDIREYFDTHLNVTMAELAELAGMSVDELRDILMGENE